MSQTSAGRQKAYRERRKQAAAKALEESLHVATDRERGLPRSNYREDFTKPIQSMSQSAKDAILARINRVPHG